MGKNDDKQFSAIMDALEVIHAENVFIITEYLANMGAGEAIRNDFKDRWNAHFENIHKNWWKDEKEK